jgi:hypothetical protein
VMAAVFAIEAVEDVADVLQRPVRLVARATAADAMGQVRAATAAGAAAASAARAATGRATAACTGLAAAEQQLEEPLQQLLQLQWHARLEQASADPVVQHADVFAVESLAAGQADRPDPDLHAQSMLRRRIDGFAAGRSIGARREPA